MEKRYLLGLLILMGMYLISCKKSSYLDALPNQSLVVPTTLLDFQKILDNDIIMNGEGGDGKGSGMSPGFEEAGTDDYYADTILNNYVIAYQNLYKYSDDLYSFQFPDWDFPYRCVFYSNVVLDGLQKLSPNTNNAEFNNVKGSALFYRAHAFYHLAQTFAPPYDGSTAESDYGIPLRLTSDVNEKITRASVKDTYSLIIGDLKAAMPLLPVTPLYKTRPSKPAAYALLSRVYLSMRDYKDAFLYADSTLKNINTLIDYNTVDSTGGYFSFPFQRFNSEVIFHSVQIENTLVGLSIAMVDSTLYKTYDQNDLRKSLFYGYQQGFGFSFRGSYDGTYELFSGLTTDEAYLTRAECSVRNGNVQEGLADLNILLKTRWKTGAFNFITAISPADALNKILLERRKELVFRATRWMDLRRLNKEGANITVTRIFKGQTYTLPPNGLHYTYLIPPDVIGLNPGMQQNKR